MTQKSPTKIILDYLKTNQLNQKLQQFRQARKKIVLTSGSFDMLHIGHARYLQKAKQHGDLLIVGVDSDQKIKARKGPDRPLIPQKERLEMLTYLRSVDLIVLKKAQQQKWQLIKTVKPDVLITIQENYTSSELKKLASYCGQVKVLKRQATTSTSAKLRLIQIKAAKKIEIQLTKKLNSTISKAFQELKGES
ncbi:MAG: adenylyltransferase/cytidyltransferase family protein [Candidatus Pacebacteria bacterium]|nr:adenylyltransferase/cytidyltransferase family protein [Candidatus Paceibacterota bacterium]